LDSSAICRESGKGRSLGMIFEPLSNVVLLQLARQDVGCVMCNLAHPANENQPINIACERFFVVTYRRFKRFFNSRLSTRSNKNTNLSTLTPCSPDSPFHFHKTIIMAFCDRSGRQGPVVYDSRNHFQVKRREICFELMDFTGLTLRKRSSFNALGVCGRGYVGGKWFCDNSSSALIFSHLEYRSFPTVCGMFCGRYS